MGLISGLFSKKEKINNDPLFVPKTVQESIPYRGMFENGILQVDARTFSKMYSLADMNFSIESYDGQRAIVSRYMEFLSSFGPEIHIQILIYNKSIKTTEFESRVMLTMQNDNFNSLREEFNDILIDKMSNARNNIVHEKYVVLSTQANDIEDAINKFSRIDVEIAKSGQRLTGSECKAISATDRLSILFNIYNMHSSVPFYQKARMKDGNISESFSLKHVKRMGITTKDVIGPSAMEFQPDYIMLGDTYARVLFINDLPSYLRGDVLTELANMPFNMITSVHYRVLQQEYAIRLLKNRTVDINQNVVEQQKKASKNGYSADLISPELKNSQKEVEQLMNDLTGDNQKLFMTSIVITVYAENLEMLDKHTKLVESTAERFICKASKLRWQQENGFNSCLPIGKNFLKIERMLNTYSASIFVPFSVKEFMQDGGIYYGLNAVSKQLILYDRCKLKSGNGIITGATGTGKSVKTKEELFQVFLSTNDDIFIIDPENEYGELVKMLGGTVVRIAPGADVHINPMDLDLDYADKDDPLSLKSDFIASLVETALGSRYPLSPVMKSIVDRCVKNVYERYVDALRAQNKAFDNTIVPTLNDLYEEFLNQPEPEAQTIALSMERLVTGTQNSFSHRTNIDINNRLICYNTKDIGNEIKDFGLEVCLDHIWNKMIANWRKGRRTRLYCDEFHLLFMANSSAKYTRQIWKRARKWNGYPTGITQQLEDLLNSEEGRAIVSNSDFIIMLGLDPFSRMQFQRMFGLSDTEMEYVSTSTIGQGLIYNGSDVIPFIDDIPNDTKLYKAITTKPEEAEGRS